jgi:4Fe-4S ferredoxin
MTHQRPASMTIFKLLPHTNCKQCGERTCYTFAIKLAASQKKLADCLPLAEAQYAKQRRALETLVGEGPC